MGPSKSIQFKQQPPHEKRNINISRLWGMINLTQISLKNSKIAQKLLKKKDIGGEYNLELLWGYKHNSHFCESTSIKNQLKLDVTIF